MRFSPARLALPVLLLAGMALVAAVAMRTDRTGQSGSGLSERFDYDLARYKTIDPTQLGYRQTGQLDLESAEPRALAIGPDDSVYVAAAAVIERFAPDGTRQTSITLEVPADCLAVASPQHAAPGRLYLGVADHVEIYEGGKRTATWDSFGEKSVLTAIALAEQDVFIADAGQRIVWRCDTTGKVLGRIGDRDAERGIRGFFVPSPYFDLALAPDGLLRVVNPAAHRIEVYTFDGDLETYWGEASVGLEGFSGCCNPAHIAIFADGRVATAEKGLPRVKVYDAEGTFLTAVAAPDMFSVAPTIEEETRPDHRAPVIDVAVDTRGRVLVLDPAARAVRIFEPLPATAGGEP